MVKWNTRDAVRAECESRIRDIARLRQRLIDYPQLGRTQDSVKAELEALLAEESSLLQKVERKRGMDAGSSGASNSAGQIPYNVRRDPWTEDVLNRGPGEYSREAYVALPKRAVLAAYAAAGVSKKEAQNTVEYNLAAQASAGDKEAMTALKKRAGHHRSRWVNHQGGDKAAQLSFIGRALPPPPMEKARAALLQHRLDYTSKFETQVSILTRARAFANRWARKRVFKPKGSLGFPSWPSSSSCLERGASKGGQLRHLLANHSFDDLPIQLPHSRAGAVAGLECRFVQAALRDLSDGQPPRSRVTCLRERGLKTRVVTVSPSSCQTLGHAVRKRLLKALKSTPGTYAPLTGASSSEIGGLFVGKEGTTLVSTDLTRATDLIPHDLASAIIDGLADSGRLTPLEISVLRILAGPQTLVYGEEEVLSSRGLLMGLPTSWVILSLIHLFWLEESFAVSRIPRNRRAAAICGDDAFVLTSVKGAARYQQIVSQCGGEPSEGKHYECHGRAGGTLRGVFLEKLFEFDWDERTRTVLSSTLCGVIPVKGLTSRSLPRELFGDTPLRCDSFAMIQISVLDLLGRESRWIDACKRYIARVCPWLGRFAKTQLGLVPGHPLALGGYRFSPPTAASDESANLVRCSGRSFTLGLARESDPSWRTSVQMAKVDTDRLRDAGRLIDVGFVRPLDWNVQGPLLEGAIRLPEGFWCSNRDEYEGVTTLGMFYQMKAFCDRESEIFTLRSKDARRLLTRLREAGRNNPVYIPEGAKPGDFLVAWLPNEMFTTRPSHSLQIRQQSLEQTVSRLGGSSLLRRPVLQTRKSPEVL